MEQRLVDANAFYKQLEEIRAEYIEENTMSSIFAAEIIETVQDSYLKDAPTIDPVRRGKWISHTYEEDEVKTTMWAYDECSCCHKGVVGQSNYCPHCGAKMEGEQI